MSVQNPHDRFFRESFSRLEIARNFLEEYLAPEVRELLDLEQMVLQDGSFVDEEMRAHQSDLLYEVGLKEGAANTAVVYFLFEHKSYPDPLVALQLLRYMVRLWERQAKDGVSLQPIIPLVIYHGEKAWRISPYFQDLFNLPPALRPYMPHFQYQLRDFSHLSDETIRGEVWLRVFLAVLRAIFTPHLRDELPTLMDLVFQLQEKRTGIEYMYTILYYMSEATERVKRVELDAVVRQRGSLGEKLMATIAQEYIKEGIKEGIEQGIEQGRKKEARLIARQLLKLHDVVTVSEITRLSLAEVEALLREEQADSEGEEERDALVNDVTKRDGDLPTAE